MQVKTTITINAPIDDVFKAFSDLSRAADLIEGIQEIEVLEGPACMAVGTKWRETREMFGKTATEVMWVTELEANKRYAVEAQSHGTKYWSEYLFEEEDGKTHVRLTFKGTPITLLSKILGTLMFPLFAAATKKALHQDMMDLKKHLEK